MDADDLVKLGLSNAEATLYLALLRIGASNVQGLINETGFYKSNTYQTLERLCEKGIISKIVEDGKRVYQLQNPNSLIEWITNKKCELAEQEQLAKTLAKQVTRRKKHNVSSETAMVFKGIRGVKQIYSEIIEKKLDYFVFGSPLESETLIGEYYWKNLHAKQKAAKFKAKLIFHKSLRHWTKDVPKNVIQLRFFDEKLEPLTETTIYGTKVAFTVWTTKPTVTIINNEHVALAYKQIFDMLWKKAKV